MTVKTKIVIMVSLIAISLFQSRSAVHGIIVATPEIRMWAGKAKVC